MSTSLAEAQRYMSLYGLSTFYILGTIGNFLLICICTQRTHRRNPCSLYLLSASIVNLILIQCILPISIYSANSVDPQNVVLIWCKIRSYLFNVLLMLYRWYKMAACIDRAAMCNRHAWIRSFSDVRISYRAIFIITIVWILIPSHLAVYFRIESDRCVPQSGAYAKFFSAYSIVVSGWSPPIVMVIFGSIAYVSFKKIRLRVIPMNDLDRVNGISVNNRTERRRNYRRISRRDQQLLRSLICEVFLYILTNLLYSINITYSAITSGEAKTLERIQIELFLSYFSTPFLIIINNCAPFYLYLLVSSKFREDLFTLFTSCYRNQRIIPEANNRPIVMNRMPATNQGVTTINSSQSLQ